MVEKNSINIAQQIKDKYIFIYRILCALLIVLVPAFGIATYITNPEAQTPPILRELLVFFALIILVGSYKNNWIKANMQKVMILLFALVAMWQLLVLNINDFDTNKCIGFLLVSFAISVGFESKKYYLIFISVFLIAIIIILFSNPNAIVNKTVFLLTLFSIQLISYFLNSSKISTEKAIINTNSQLIIKSNEILDSINYAKRIQSAIIPSQEELKELMPNSFIFYQPKAIVSGDFYWLKRIDGIQFFAVADCTGHGVPGAMVSIVCNNALNRAINEFYLTEPAKILNKTRELLINDFSHSTENVSDGMDIVMCSIDGLKLQFAGAHNPLWICRNNEIIEIKGDKQPIGNFLNRKPFTNHKVELEKNDVIYLATDGYADQFGGENGKKMKRKNLKKILVEISTLSNSDKEKTLDSKFHKWKKSIEQVDDVCILGISID